MVQKVKSKFNELFLGYTNILESDMYKDNNANAVHKEFPVSRPEGGRSITLSESEFMTRFKENCKGYSEDSMPLYRGIQSKISYNLGDLGFIDPTTSYRAPSETFTFGQWFMDNDEHWEGVARRSKSVITSASFAGAWGYASHNPATLKRNVYTVIPYDNSKISYIKNMRDGEDIWFVFQGNADRSVSVPDLNRVTNLMLVVKKVHTSVNEQNFLETIKNIKCSEIIDIDNTIQKDSSYIEIIQTNNKNAHIPRPTINSFSKVVEFLGEHTDLISMYDLFVRYYDPAVVGTESSQNLTKNLNITNSECWVEGPCLLFLGDSALLWQFIKEQESTPTFESTYSKLLYSAESIAGVISMDHL
jgi:hypothetical protein